MTNKFLEKNTITIDNVLPKEKDILSGFSNSTKTIASIIVLTFNQRDTICDTINSILWQKTKYKYELIIHDDASNDGTRDILLEYGKLYPNIIRLKLRDVNLYSKGEPFISDIVADTKGEYIAYCEGDDFWIHRDKLDRQLDLLESENVDLVHTKCKIMKGKKVFDDNCLLNHDSNISESIFMHNYTVRFASVCIRKELLFQAHDIVNKILPRPIKLYDLPVWYVLSKLGKIKYLDDEMVMYRVVDNSVSRSTSKMKNLEFSFYVNAMLMSLGDYSTLSIKEKCFLFRRITGTIKFSLILSDYKKVLVSLKMMLALVFK